MEEISIWFYQVLRISPDLQRKLLLSLIILVTLWIMHRLLLRIVVQRIKDQDSRYQWQKALGYLFSIIGVITVSVVLFEGVQYAATYLGLLSAGIAIALKDPLTNIIGWMFILWRRPFEVGDRIQIDQHSGDVIDIRLFQFSLMEIGNWVHADQSTGRILHVPNGLVFTSVLANYTKAANFIWNEISIQITFESNWHKAKEILLNIASEQHQKFSDDASRDFETASKRFFLKYDKLTPIVYTSVIEYGVELTIRYLCRPRNRRGSSEIIWEAILNNFNEHADIELAYPTRRFFNYRQESKSLPETKE